MFILKELNRLLNDEEGLTTVEYAVAGALVASAVVVAFENLGGAVTTEINGLCGVIENGSSGASCT
ncbi:hypothetical protein GCM10022421_34240 [Oceanisphaera sediminis]|uniref:Flp family type IVb pilin n=1 Tax=Oceanisphaera sediminis TaxID=981381 RepID=A0ABP7EQ88_9GAMM